MAEGKSGQGDCSMGLFVFRKFLDFFHSESSIADEPAMHPSIHDEWEFLNKHRILLIFPQFNNVPGNNYIY